MVMLKIQLFAQLPVYTHTHSGTQVGTSLADMHHILQSVSPKRMRSPIIDQTRFPKSRNPKHRENGQLFQILTKKFYKSHRPSASVLPPTAVQHRDHKHLRMMQSPIHSISKQSGFEQPQPPNKQPSTQRMLSNIQHASSRTGQVEQFRPRVEASQVVPEVRRQRAEQFRQHVQVAQASKDVSEQRDVRPDYEHSADNHLARSKLSQSVWPHVLAQKVSNVAPATFRPSELQARKFVSDYLPRTDLLQTSTTPHQHTRRLNAPGTSPPLSLFQNDAISEVFAQTVEEARRRKPLVMVGRNPVREEQPQFLGNPAYAVSPASGQPGPKVTQPPFVQERNTSGRPGLNVTQQSVFQERNTPMFKCQSIAIQERYPVNPSSKTPAPSTRLNKDLIDIQFPPTWGMIRGSDNQAVWISDSTDTLVSPNEQHRQQRPPAACNRRKKSERLEHPPQPERRKVPVVGASQQMPASLTTHDHAGLFQDQQARASDHGIPFQQKPLLQQLIRESVNEDDPEPFEFPSLM